MNRNQMKTNEIHLSDPTREFIIRELVISQINLYGKDELIGKLWGELTKEEFRYAVYVILNPELFRPSW